MTWIKSGLLILAIIDPAARSDGDRKLHGGGVVMPHYRMYCLRSDNRIAHALNVFSSNDQTVVNDAISIGHDAIVEVWSGKRMVARVDPIGVNAYTVDASEEASSLTVPIVLRMDAATSRQN